MFKRILLGLLLLTRVFAFLHPVTVQGRYFVDTITNEPFYIKGLDYQPGGSSGVVEYRDPLSDPVSCARDILLFQDLGINTIRVYSINTQLNHDICMSMLAAAGIYLVLDVNSPLPGHHLDRYQPWNTYNTEYLENAFKVVEQFLYYNNTLGFFAGNEIINDKTSAINSPVYVKAVVRDIKDYIKYNSPRPVPVGYSAADDMRYRISFSQYLECMDESPSEAVDFYGVNSYQWCGDQTFYSSGYNVLVDDYLSYTLPVFFSEYGCNEVQPRKFGEIPSMYSNDMVDIFSGGLVYQYSQEPNNYGLVEIQENGDLKLLDDYFVLKAQFDSLEELDHHYVSQAMKQDLIDIGERKRVNKYGVPLCDSNYKNLDISKGIPSSQGGNLIEYGVETTKGKFVPLQEYELGTVANILDSSNKPYSISKKINPVVDYMSGIGYDKLGRIKQYPNGMLNEINSESDSESETDSDSEESKSVFQIISEYLSNASMSIAKLFSGE